MGLCFYTIDIETNGLSQDFHEISEISIIRDSDRMQFSKFIRIEHPERSSKEALIKTGRTHSDLRKGSPAKDVVEMIEKFFAEDKLTLEHRCGVAHQANFDRTRLYKLFEKYGKVFPVATWLDTKPIMKYYAQTYLGIVKPKLTLQDCLEYLEIKGRGVAHSAISDTQNLYLIKRALDKKGIDLLPYIKRLPQVDSVIPSEDEE